jgi:hypothetical protein
MVFYVITLRLEISRCYDNEYDSLITLPLWSTLFNFHVRDDNHLIAQDIPEDSHI